MKNILNVIAEHIPYKYLLGILIGICFVLFATGMLIGSQFIHTPNVTDSGNRKLYWGIYIPNVPQDMTPLTALESQIQKKVSIVMWYQGWGVSDNTKYFQTSWMDDVRNNGSYPLITWEPWDYTQGLSQPNFSLKEIINGTYDAYITKWADASKVWGHPYFLRFAQEMNGNWYPWSEQVNGNQPGQFVSAWRHIHDIFVTEGATNVTWVWSPNVAYNGSTPLTELYPGDAYVDWVGMDGYNWGISQADKTWQSFATVFQQTYTDLLTITNKPMMVAETASAEVGGDKANWITDAYTTQIPSNFTRIKAVTWFNENKETDWTITSSINSQNAFTRAINLPYYSSNISETVNTNPIPPAN